MDKKLEQNKMDANRELMLLREMMQSVPVGIVMMKCKADGTVRPFYMNEAFLEMFGMDEETALRLYKQDAFAGVHPDDVEQIHAYITRCIAGEVLPPIEYRLIHTDGSYRWVSVRVRCIHERDEAGENTLYGCYTDVTDNHDLKVELERQRIKEKTVLESMPGGVAIYRIKNDYSIETEYASHGFAKLSGYDSVEEFQPLLQGNPFFDVPEDDQQAMMSAITEGLANNQTFIGLFYHICRKDGSVILARLDANKMDTDLREDELAVFYAVQTPVSEEEKQTIDEQQMLHKLISEVPAGIGIYEIENGVVSLSYINDVYFQILRTTPEARKKFLGLNVLDAVHPNDIPGIKQKVALLMGGETQTTVEYRHIMDDGSCIWIRLLAKVVERRNGHLRVYAVLSDITDAVESRKEAEISNRTMEIAMNESQVIVWHYDYKTRCITDTGTFGKKFGLPKRIENGPQAMLSGGYISEKSADEYLDFCTGIALEKTVTCEIEGITPDRSPRWLKLTAIPVFSQKGVYTDAICMAMDISEQKLAEQRYENEYALRRELARDCIFYLRMNLTKNVIEDRFYAEPQYQDILTLIEEDPENYWENLFVRREVYQNLVSSLSAQAILNAWNNGDTEITYPVYTVKIKGEYRVLESRVSLLKQPSSGDVIAMYYTKDVTDQEIRRLMEKKLLDEHYEAVGVISCVTGNIQLMRDRLVTQVLDEVETVNYATVCAGFVKANIIAEEQEQTLGLMNLEHVKSRLDEEESYTFTVHIHDADTNKNLVRTISFYYLGETKSFITYVIEDTSDAVKKEQESLEKLQAALDIAEQATMAKMEFFSNMSHDMRTPLNGIIGSVNLALEEQEDNPIISEYLHDIKFSSEFMLNLINDLLDISKIDSGKMQFNPEAYQYTEFMADMDVVLEPLLKEKEITLYTKPLNGIDNITVLVDKVRFQQVFFNIFSNAIKYSEAGGRIEHRTEIKYLDDSHIDCSCHIKDYGIGMSEEFQKHMFEPFAREISSGYSKTQGTGLGLSIAKKIMDLMGGELIIHSKLEEGTEVIVHAILEIADLNSSGTSDVQVENSYVVLSGKRILICEDQQLNAKIAARILGKVGCLIEYAENGKIGVDMFGKSPNGYYDAILMDIRMPVLDGLEASKTIRRLDRLDAKTTPIIAMTANAYDEDRKKSEEAGMNAHLAKPVDPQVLYNVLAKYLN